MMPSRPVVIRDGVEHLILELFSEQCIHGLRVDETQ